MQKQGHDKKNLECGLDKSEIMYPATDMPQGKYSVVCNNLTLYNKLASSALPWKD